MRDTPDAQLVPAYRPDPSDLPADEASQAPAGRMRGEATTMLVKIARARLPVSVKDVLIVLHAATYAQPEKRRDGTPDPGWGWVRIDRDALAAYFDTWPSDISGRLNVLMQHRVIRRPGDRMVVCLRPWQEWDPAVFDAKAAKKRHARDGAGAPPVVRAPAPHLPLAERDGDIRARAFMSAEVVAAHVEERGGDEEATRAHWRVVEAFQRVTDQAFRPVWLDQLTSLLAAQSSTAIIAELTRVVSTYDPPNPWGYLLTCFKNTPRPKERPDGETKFTATPGRRRGVGATRDGVGAPNAGVARRIVRDAEEDEPETGGDAIGRGRPARAGTPV